MIRRLHHGDSNVSRARKKAREARSTQALHDESQSRIVHGFADTGTGMHPFVTHTRQECTFAKYPSYIPATGRNVHKDGIRKSQTEKTSKQSEKLLARLRDLTLLR